MLLSTSSTINQQQYNTHFWSQIKIK